MLAILAGREQEVGLRIDREVDRPHGAVAKRRVKNAGVRPAEGRSTGLVGPSVAASDEKQRAVSVGCKSAFTKVAV